MNGHADAVEKSAIKEWLIAKAYIWAGQEIAPEHLLKLFISDVDHLPQRFTE